ncbi:SDR family NAD(P)-dependent oxidoreductase [bacterium]|nr:SDR family NAD(P)-dependent oxidoreductase [bacterium]
MFKDKVVLITGGSSGLGLGMAHVFCEEKARIILLARNKEKLLSAQSLLKSKYPSSDVTIHSLDLANRNDLEKEMSNVLKDHQRLDVLVNCAGILAEGYFENMPIETFKDVMNTNFIALVSLTKAALPYLKQSKGRIVNVASMASFIGSFGYTSYTASKFALLGFSESLRYELKPQGINLHVVCPPEFEGPMVDGISENRTPENRFLVRSAGVLTVEQVVKETFAGIRKGKFIIPTGRNARLIRLLNRLFPGIVRWYVDSTIRKVYVGPT